MEVTKAGNQAKRLPSEGSALLRKTLTAEGGVSQTYQGGRRRAVAGGAVLVSVPTLAAGQMLSPRAARETPTPATCAHPQLSAP
jgi:hypothetical protein